MEMLFYAKTNIGKVRKMNQDAYIFLPEYNLLAVADGLGGHLAGDVASKKAIQILEEYVCEHPGIPEEILYEAFTEANRRIFKKAAEDDMLNGMGTTLTVAMIDQHRLIIAHVGDSRAYLLQEGEFHQLTKDHSLVGELVRSGNLTKEEADVHPQKNMLMRALGMEDKIDVEIRVLEIEKGSKILLTTDGMTNMLSQNELSDVLTTEKPEEALDKLVAIAMDRGGRDNITAVLGIV